MGGSETAGFQAYFVVDTTCITQPSHSLNTANLHILACLSSPPYSRRILEATVWYGCETSYCIQFYYYRCKMTTIWPSCECQEGPEVCGLENTVIGEWLEFCSVPKTAALLGSFLRMCDTDFTYTCCREKSFRILKRDPYGMPVSLAICLVAKQQSGVMFIQQWINEV